MPTLPVLPAVTDDQYTYLIDVFNEFAAANGLPGPAEAYVKWSLDNLVALVQSHAYSKLQRELDAERLVREAEVNAMLSDLINGQPTTTP